MTKGTRGSVAPPELFAPRETVVREAAARFGTPLYLYDELTLRQTAAYVCGSPHHAGLTVRYAMKAWPSRYVLGLFAEYGIDIDASSGFEAQRAILAGARPSSVQLTGQELPRDLGALLAAGVLFNACSLNQLKRFAEATDRRGKREVSIRVNPGLGSGHANRTNTGGPGSSFGIWHEYLPEVLECAAGANVSITGLHTHIGSGSDVDVWDRCAELALEVAARLPDVRRVSLGGGYKIARAADEKTTDLHAALERAQGRIARFEEQCGRQLHLEIEPGTFLVASAGALIAGVIDVVSTGMDGFQFVKLDAGMTEIIRPSLYGAQHPLTLVSNPPRAMPAPAPHLVVGHCCESGDLLTPLPHDPEGLAPRMLPRPEPGDLLVVGAAGAYCSGFSVKNYNSFPEAPEVLLDASGELHLLRKRQTLAQIVETELDLPKRRA